MGKFEIVDGKLVRYHGRIGWVRIPKGVTEIGEQAFKDCIALRSVIIPDSVTCIGALAFDHCTRLNSVNIPDSVTSIGRHAFDHCSSLTSVRLPNGLTNIEDSTFRSCKRLVAIRLPDSVTNIGNWSFENCKSLESINIPDGVTCIGAHAFYECWALRSIAIPESVTKIQPYSFSYCQSLTEVTIRNIRLDRTELDMLQRYCLDTVASIIAQLVGYQTDSYAIVWAVFWLCPEDERNTVFLRENLEKMLCFLIDRKDDAGLKDALGCGAFDEQIGACIDRCIEYANDKQAFEIQLMLTNYKAEKLGYTDVTEQFKL